jgi:hypothetical protein
VWNPPFRYLVNCAIAPGVELDDVIEDDWRRRCVTTVTHGFTF